MGLSPPPPLVTPRLRSLLIAVAVTAVAPAASWASTPVASAAVVSSTSSNWAGYADTGSRYRSVRAAWVQPAAACQASSPAYSAFWVGLGGYARDSQALEQVGSEADCGPAGGVSYRAWYELVPAAPVNLHLTVRPGDRISASVSVAGSQVTIRFADLTRGSSITRRLRMRSPDVTSAEWIAEAPSGCDGGGTCRPLPLADFGQVGFIGASATTIAGHAGAIADPAWSTTQITLRDVQFRRGPARFSGAVAGAEAVPGLLSSDSSAFAVTWRQAQVSPGSGQGGLGSGAGGVPGGA